METIKPKDPDLVKVIAIERLPLTGDQCFHYKDGLEPNSLGDRVFELDPRTRVLVDVSLGLHTWSRVHGKDVAITESSVVETLIKYLKERFSEELSAREVVNLCASFLEDKEIVNQEKITDVALSVAVCQKNNSELIFAGFGSTGVFGPGGENLISSQKPYDPLAPERRKGIIALLRRRKRRVTRKLKIQEARIPRGQPVLMVTNGLDPKALDLSYFGRKGYPLEELTKDPSCFVKEALVVRIGNSNG